MNKVLIVIVIVLLIVIGALTWMLYQNPALVASPQPIPSKSSSSTGPSSSSAQATPLKKPLVTSPKAGAKVGSSIEVEGKAPGSWYFEASFPIQVRDADNNKIGQTQAQAQSEWMTEGAVPFRATVTTSGYKGPATLVLLKDNPSGLPENDDSFEVPIVIQ